VPSTATTAQLQALLDRLQAEQRALIANAARIAMMPSDGTIRRISDLENSIAAVEALMHEQRPGEGK
jgi:hypothetical protein